MPIMEVPLEVERRLSELGGRTINLYRVLAHRPRLLSAYVEFAWALRRECEVSRALRELLIVREAQLCDAPYEAAHHAAMARRVGVPEDKLASVAHWRSSEAFSLRERAALRFIEEIVDARVTDASFAELRASFSDAECVELTLTASFYAMVPRVLQALQVPMDDPSVELEPEPSVAPTPPPSAPGGVAT